jgi:hypothetical protein
MSPLATVMLVYFNCFKQTFEYNIRTAEPQIWKNVYFSTETRILCNIFIFYLFFIYAR